MDLWFNNQIFTGFEAATIMLNKVAFFYVQTPLIKPCLNNDVDMVKMVCEILKSKGYTCVLVDYDTLKTEDIIKHDGNPLHFWLKDIPPLTAKHKDLFYMSPSYLKGYWLFNKVGLRNSAFMRDKAFDPSNVDADNASAFFQKLRGRFLSGKHNKYAQPDNPDITIPQDCIVFPAQDIEEPDHYKIHVDFWSLLHATIANRGDKAVWIKPHPAMINLKTNLELAKFHDPDNGIFFEDCNLHDLLARASMVVTRDSSLAFEALLHKVPSIIAADLDFHHVSKTIETVGALPAAMDEMAQANFEYEKFLLWFLKRHHVAPAQHNRAMQQIEKQLERTLG